MNQFSSKVDTFLPVTGVLFLGGHPNMVKKIQKLYPKWDYVFPEHCNRKREFHQSLVFYWTKHSSHKLMRYVYSRLDKKSEIHFVTATNTDLLFQEMKSLYTPTSAISAC